MADLGADVIRSSGPAGTVASRGADGSAISGCRHWSKAMITSAPRLCWMRIEDSGVKRAATRQVIAKRHPPGSMLFISPTEHLESARIGQDRPCQAMKECSPPGRGSARRQAQVEMVGVCQNERGPQLEQLARLHRLDGGLCADWRKQGSRSACGVQKTPARAGPDAASSKNSNDMMNSDQERSIY